MINPPPKQDHKLWQAFVIGSVLYTEYKMRTDPVYRARALRRQHIWWLFAPLFMFPLHWIFGVELPDLIGWLVICGITAVVWIFTLNMNRGPDYIPPVYPNGSLVRYQGDLYTVVTSNDLGHYIISNQLGSIEVDLSDLSKP